MKKTMKCASLLLVSVMLAGCSEKAPETAAELMERVKEKNFDNYALVMDYGFTIPDAMELSLNMDVLSAAGSSKTDMTLSMKAVGVDLDMDVVVYGDGTTSYVYIPELDTWSAGDMGETTTLSSDLVMMGESMTDVAVLSEEGNSYVLTVPLSDLIESSVFDELFGMGGSQSTDDSVIKDALLSLFSDAEMKMTYDKKSYEPQYFDFDVSAEGATFMMHGEFSGYGEIEEDEVAVPEEGKAAVASAAPTGEPA